MKEGKIWIIEGVLGAGKTLFAVELILEHLAAGGYVYTNIKLFHEKVQEYLAEENLVYEPMRVKYLEGELSTFYLQISRGEEGSVVMVVIDEASLSDMKARNWDKLDDDLLALNVYARKLNLWLIYISQAKEDLVKQFRRKAGVIWNCRNMKEYRIGGIIPFPIPVFYRVPMHNRGGDQKPVIMPGQMLISSPAKGCYDTKQLAGESAAMFEQLPSVRGTPLKKLHPAPSINYPLVAGLACAASYLTF